MNVLPARQRGFIGMTLLKALFERAAYGCRLYSCWCAQDIEANRFWESMGFVPLAYRAGSTKKARVHIFWQKRIREGDVTTPYWYPSETKGGQMGAARIVLPIPPGKHWSDELTVLLPGAPAEQPALSGVDGKQIADQKPRREKAAIKKPAVVERQPVNQRGGLYYTRAPDPAAPKAAQPKPQKKPNAKNDPKLVAAARELRDRWLEHVNSGATLIESVGKYDVTRALPDATSPAPAPALLLPAAA
jgi:hypothetical protein